MSKIQTVTKEINRKQEVLAEKLKLFQGELSGLNQSISLAAEKIEKERAQAFYQKQLEEAVAREKALEETAEKQAAESAEEEKKVGKSRAKTAEEKDAVAADQKDTPKKEEMPNVTSQQGTAQRPQSYNSPQGQGSRPYNSEQQAPRSYNSQQGQRPYNNQQGQRPYNNQQGQGPRQYNNQQGQGPRPYNNQQGQGPRPYNNQQGQGQRPYNNQQRRPGGPAIDLTPSSEKGKVSNYDPNKKMYRDKADDKKTAAKKSASKGGFVRVGSDDGERVRGPRKKQKFQTRPEPIKIEKAIITNEEISIKELAEKIGKPAADIIKKLFLLGVMATINHEIDFDTASVIAADYDIELELKLEKTYEEVLSDADTSANINENQVERPPVVTIMGHVDHGKTSLLDAIRYSNITSHEAGGITQHIGAYMISVNDRNITFIDTPGHEAFTSMRARGAQITDVAIIVVAADDGIMPQTVEAINHVKAAKVPIIVAINKMDKPTANADKVKQELTEHGLVAEEWGGDTVVVPVSAHTKEGLDVLLDMILLVAEVAQLKADPVRKAKGTIIEAKLDKGRGPVATVLVQNGTLKVGDTVVAGTAYGRVRAMIDDKGNKVNEAPPSTPVEVLGFNDVPEAGDIMNAVDDDKLSRQVADERKNKLKSMQQKAKAKASLEDLFSQIKAGEVKELNVIVKADVQGSVEAVKQAIEKLSDENVKVCTIHGGVGAITETDIMFASTANAIIIGFNVRPEAAARAVAERENVDIRLYRVIYEAIEDIQKAMKGLLDPVFVENVTGHAEVRATFKVSDVGTIAGCYVTDGKIARSSKVRILRDNVVVFEGGIESLKRVKDDVREVSSGYECGICLSGYNDVKISDVIEAYVIEQVKDE